jgi:uncharacterized FlgJ-related protein|tara:strand:- start:153 stop:719 length:567 start_codon:yes stop_codon:yes gene_type:complete
MIYKFDKTNLIYKKDWKSIKIFSISILFALLTSFVYGRYAKIDSLGKYERELIVLNLKTEQSKFSKDKLVELLKDLNVKFPHIVMAQSMIETGKWKSNIFKENHNLFGMKQANRRVNTAKGTQNNHAFYTSWEESVYDYAFYQCRYLGSIQTEAEYFQYLSNSYAENDEYVQILKKTIQTNNLKQFFN